LLPFQPLLAVQPVAFVDDQVSVACPPAGTVVGLTDNVAIGGGATVTVALALAGVPFVPLQFNR
jgi:hypothetical protein